VDVSYSKPSRRLSLAFLLHFSKQPPPNNNPYPPVYPLACIFTLVYSTIYGLSAMSKDRVLEIKILVLAIILLAMLIVNHKMDKAGGYQSKSSSRTEIK